MKSILISAAIMLPIFLEAAERDHQLPFCDYLGGQAEVILPDRTRVDCMTGHHAIEVDYARKWAEAIGQSLHYAKMTGKAPGIAIIIESEKDRRYLDRLYGVINRWHLPVQVWVITE